MTVEPPEGDSKTIAQIVEEIWQNRDRDYNTKRLVKRLQRIDKNMSGEARELFARFIPDGDIGHFAEGLPTKLRGDFAGTMKILRDPDLSSSRVSACENTLRCCFRRNGYRRVRDLDQGRRRKGVQACGLLAALCPLRRRPST
ncbi:helicase, type I site-specific restriction-modification system restriction subunit [Mycobacteroides abscessus subsp. abscessus]|nr:helicase, type I site-specific restriction-modification system restriction subunit [Mycobacteroides abscessus subsp. abscessus]